MDTPVWRKIVSRKTLRFEHTSVNGRSLTWWVTRTQVVTLSCGHTKVYSEDSSPRKKAHCHECAKVTNA